MLIESQILGPAPSYPPANLAKREKKNYIYTETT